MKRRGQVTIFIIVAVLIVAGIIGALLFTGEKELKKPRGVTPDQFIKNCVVDAVEEKFPLILERGGRLNPEKNISYEGIPHNYLCYQADYYLPCYNLEPELRKNMQKEIEEATKDKVRECFNQMKEEYENRGFDVSGGSTSYSVDILPNSIRINLKKDVEISMEETAQKFSDFSTSILSETYDILDIASNIVNAEAKYCYFEYGGYMILHPEYNIRRINYEGSKIYSITHRLTKETFDFAVRSCAPKPGL